VSPNGAEPQTPQPPPDIEERKVVARALLAEGIEPVDLELQPELAALPTDAALTADLGIQFPDGLGPVPQPIVPTPDPGDRLPRADVVVITWTVAELNALADVLTPGHPRAGWYRYNRRFEEHYAPLIRPGAPSLAGRRLGSYFPTKVGDKTVLCMKSELHLNQDGIATGEGTATLPVKDFFAQIIEEVQPSVVLTVGTSGGVALDQDLGDAVVTRGAKFRCTDEFRNEAFNGQTYTSDWEIPTSHFEAAEELMRGYANELEEPGFGPPTKRYPMPDGPLLRADPPNVPSIQLDGRDLPKFHPILTTDFFEFGTSSNHLETEGCAVEMGDAVLGLLCSEMPNPPRWAVVRNISDPQINGDLPVTPRRGNQQRVWAVWYYDVYGYWTSVTGALATWGILAGLASEG
jgi:nucleoside phosphorylase